MNRRSLLIGIGAALATPAIVRAESLMRVVMPKRELVTGDAYFLGEDGQFYSYDGELVMLKPSKGVYYVTGLTSNTFELNGGLTLQGATQFEVGDAVAFNPPLSEQLSDWWESRHLDQKPYARSIKRRLPRIERA